MRSKNCGQEGKCEVKNTWVLIWYADQEISGNCGFVQIKKLAVNGRKAQDKNAGFSLGSLQNKNLEKSWILEKSKTLEKSCGKKSWVLICSWKIENFGNCGFWKFGKTGILIWWDFVEKLCNREFWNSGGLVISKNWELARKGNLGIWWNWEIVKLWRNSKLGENKRLVDFCSCGLVKYQEAKAEFVNRQERRSCKRLQLQMVAKEISCKMVTKGGDWKRLLIMGAGESKIPRSRKSFQFHCGAIKTKERYERTHRRV